MLAIEKLYEKYRQDVYRYLLSLTRDTDVAEDLLSDCNTEATLFSRGIYC